MLQTGAFCIGSIHSIVNTRKYMRQLSITLLLAIFSFTHAFIQQWKTSTDRVRACGIWTLGCNDVWQLKINHQRVGPLWALSEIFQIFDADAIHFSSFVPMTRSFQRQIALVQSSPAPLPPSPPPPPRRWNIFFADWKDIFKEMSLEMFLVCQ